MEMATGQRHKTFNDHWAAWNWRKIIMFGTLMLVNLHKALQMFNTNRVVFLDISASFVRNSQTGVLV
jgi:hypothetical protein